MAGGTQQRPHTLVVEEAEQVDTTDLPPLVMRRLFALLAHPSVSETLLRERLDALYRRLLDSPIFTPPARRACDGDDSPPDAPDPLLHRYLANLPSLCRERTASGGGGGGGGGAAAAAARRPLPPTRR